MSAPSTYEMEMDSRVLSNLAWSRLSELMEEGLSRNKPDADDISEAELLLQFKRAIATKSDFLLVRLRYDETDKHAD